MWISTDDATALTGLSATRLRDLRQQHRIVARKYRGHWQWDQQSLVWYCEQIANPASDRRAHPLRSVVWEWVKSEDPAPSMRDIRSRLLAEYGETVTEACLRNWLRQLLMRLPVDTWNRTDQQIAERVNCSIGLVEECRYRHVHRLGLAKIERSPWRQK